MGVKRLVRWSRAGGSDGIASATGAGAGVTTRVTASDRPGFGAHGGIASGAIALGKEAFTAGAPVGKTARAAAFGPK